MSDIEETEYTSQQLDYLEFLKLLKPHKPVVKKVTQYLDKHDYTIRNHGDFEPLNWQSLDVPKSWFGHQFLHGLEMRMVDIMNQSNGVGLAAIQIGLPLNMFVTNTPDEGVQSFYNPIIHTVDDPYQVVEGCLSLSEKHDVLRYKRVLSSSQNWEGVSTMTLFSNFTAEVILHEMDHLQGKMINGLT